MQTTTLKPNTFPVMIPTKAGAERIDLAPFCDAESNRFARPFLLEASTYACNGRICVRVPCLQGDARDGREIPFDPRSAFDLCDQIEPVAWVVDGDKLQLSTDCPACDDGRQPGPKCEECDGRGSKTCNLGHDHDCSYCGGRGHDRGTRPCAACLGSGKLHVRQVCGAHISNLYANLIDGLPDVVVEGIGYGTWGHVPTRFIDRVRFRFGLDCVGIVMGVAP